MEVCHSDALAAPAMHASESQRGNGSHNADRAAANPHVKASRLSGARRRGGQKQAGQSQNDHSNREFRHGTLPRAADFCETRTADGTKSSGGGPTKVERQFYKMVIRNVTGEVLCLIFTIYLPSKRRIF
jgi:hypothetical protein